MTEVEKSRVRWSVGSVTSNTTVVGGIDFDTEKVEKLMLQKGRHSVLPEETELYERMLALKSANVGDYFVINVDTSDTDRQSVVDSRVATIRAKISKIVVDQDWPLRAGAGSTNSRRCYETIPYAENGKTFLIIRKTKPLELSEHSMG